MTYTYYPRHTLEQLTDIANDPIPAQDVPRLAREVAGLKEENEKLRALLREASVWMLADRKMNEGWAERVLALKTRIDMTLERP